MKLRISVILTIVALTGINVFAQKSGKMPPLSAEAQKTQPKAKQPTVQEILARYVEALGGRATYEKVKTRSMRGTIEIAAAGIKGTVESIAAAPDKSYSNGNLTGIGEMIESYDGKTAWSVNPIQGNRDKAGQELLQAKLMSNFYREINLDKLYSKLEYKGVDKVGESDVYVVVATADGLPPETFYFDAKSGLLLRTDMTMVTPEGNTTSTSYFEDFRDVDGTKIPFRTRTVLPQFELVTVFTEVKNNVAIDESKFAKPKQ